jgi:predicted dehydrogenase
LAPAILASGKSPPSNRVRIGLIGCGGRGRELLTVFHQFADVDVPVISDVNEPRMEQAAKVLAEGDRPQKPDLVVEHERILDRKDVDAVLIATTQHWHGIPFIQAAQAGKHIYVEKPFSHTVVEGRAMVEAARRSGVTAMMGVQQRGYPHYLKASEILRSERLGKIALVECWNYERLGRRVGKPADADPPVGLHWDRWLGPAPWVPFNPARLNNSWWFDYGGGMLTNWAIHHIDIILWAMQVANPTAVSCSGGKFVVDDLADTPDTVEACWEFPGFVMQYRLPYGAQAPLGWRAGDDRRRFRVCPTAETGQAKGLRASRGSIDYDGRNNRRLDHANSYSCGDLGAHLPGGGRD